MLGCIFFICDYQEDSDQKQYCDDWKKVIRQFGGEVEDAYHPGTYLNNYFRLHVCLSFRPWVRPSHFHFFRFPAVVSQNVTYKSCLACVKRKKYASWVTIRPQWDCCCRGEAEVRIIDFKTTWSEFQMPSQTAPAEAKPRCV